MIDRKGFLNGGKNQKCNIGHEKKSNFLKHCNLCKSSHRVLDDQLGQLDENLEKLLEKVDNQRIKNANLENEIECQEKVIIETQRVSEETEKNTALSLEGLGPLRLHL